MSKEEQEAKARRLEECYKTLAKVLAETYSVPPPEVEFSWKLYTDFGAGATYLFKKHKIMVTYDTKPDEFAHEFKHYLQDVVEGRDYDEEIHNAILEGKLWFPNPRAMAWTLPIEKEANRFGSVYRTELEYEGRREYGSAIYTYHTLRDKFREGIIPDFVIRVFKRVVMDKDRRILGERF